MDIDESFLKRKKDSSIKKRSIITIGRIEPDKGMDMLVPVAAVLKKYTSWKWKLYGNGDAGYIASLKSKLKDNNICNVEFMGITDNVISALDEASIFVLLSKYEGFSMVLLEAKSRELPLVSFDINSGPSEIIQDGIDGFLVEPFNIDEIANKICELIENHELRKRFSDNAYGNIDSFKKKAVINQWCELINRL